MVMNTDFFHRPPMSIYRPVLPWTMTLRMQNLNDGSGPARRSADHEGSATRKPATIPWRTAIAMFILGDVFIHTWDVARATGLDETLDAGEVHRMLIEAEPYDAMLRASGQYGPRVAVGPDADEQTRLIAFMGRQP